MTIITNPPYSGSLHLKILREAMKHSDDIVNLSPIRWLQDPLAEYKKGSDYEKYADIRARISSVDVINSSEGNRLFGISFGDLGVSHITPSGGFNTNQLRKKSPLLKVVEYGGRTFMDVATPEGYNGKYDGLFGVINSHYGNISEFISDNFNLFIEPRYTNTNKVLWFTSEAEIRNCFDYLTSNFMKKYARFIRVNQRVPWQFVPYLDFSQPWTDQMLYDYFGLNEEEINIIEGTIRDPCLGAGGLIAAAIIAGADPKKCYGIELDPSTHALAIKRLSRLGVPSENIILGSCFDEACWEKIKDDDNN